MKPPSEMTVVSELLPLLLLEALDERLIFSTLSTVSSIVLPPRRGAGGGTSGVRSTGMRSTDTSVRRAGGVALLGAVRRRCGVTSAVAFDTEGAMEDIDGRRSELRRATDPLSSAFLRPGEFWDVFEGSGRLSAKTSIAERLLL